MRKFVLQYFREGTCDEGKGQGFCRMTLSPQDFGRVCEDIKKECKEEEFYELSRVYLVEDGLVCLITQSYFCLASDESRRENLEAFAQKYGLPVKLKAELEPA